MSRTFTLQSARSGSIGIAVPRQDGLPLRSPFRVESLAYLLTDQTGLHELRQQLYHAGLYSEVARMTDTEVLEEVRRLLRTGELRIDEAIVEVRKRTGGAIPQAQAAPVVVAPPPRKVEKEEAPDPDTLPDIDAATQAATLQAAAAQGAPFCPT